MLYQETIKITNTNAKRMLGQCKEAGISLFELSAKPKKGKMKQANQLQIVDDMDYIEEYKQWELSIMKKMDDIFERPNLKEAFNSKGSPKEIKTLTVSNIQKHITKVLLPQIYFLEIIINEIDTYKIAETIESSKTILQKIGFRNFNTDSTERAYNYQ